MPLTSRPGPNFWAMAASSWPALLHVCALIAPTLSSEKGMKNPAVNKVRISLQVLSSFQSQVGFLQVLAFASPCIGGP